MKRILAVCIALAMSILLAACGGQTAAEGGDGTYQKIEDTVVGVYKKVEKKFVDTFLEPKEDSEESDRLQHDSVPLDQG